MMNTHTTKNYTEQGGDKTVIGGILEFTEDAEVKDLPGLTELSARVTMLEEKASTLEGTVGTMSDSLSTLSETVTALSGTVTALGGRVDTLEETISGLVDGNEVGY